MSKRITFFVMLCVLALAASPRMFGQATGSFSGTVADKSGSVISGATVTATSQGTGVSARRKPTTPATTSSLCCRSRSTRARRIQGFQTTESKDVRLQVDEARELDFTLVARVSLLNGGSPRLRSGRRDRQSLARSGDHLAASCAASSERTRFRPARHAHPWRYGRNQSQQLFHRPRPPARWLRADRSRCRSADHVPTARIGCSTAWTTTN